LLTFIYLPYVISWIHAPVGEDVGQDDAEEDD
jgi:hypothetical protein